jgi:hypothetical protein
MRKFVPRAERIFASVELAHRKMHNTRMGAASAAPILCCAFFDGNGQIASPQSLRNPLPEPTIS